MDYITVMEEHLPSLFWKSWSKSARWTCVKSTRNAVEDSLLPNIATHHAPTVAPGDHESHPSYANLVGRIEYVSEQGALVTTIRKSPQVLHKPTAAT